MGRFTRALAVPVGSLLIIFTSSRECEAQRVEYVTSDGKVITRDDLRWTEDVDIRRTELRTQGDRNDVLRLAAWGLIAFAGSHIARTVLMFTGQSKTAKPSAVSGESGEGNGI